MELHPQVQGLEPANDAVKAASIFSPDLISDEAPTNGPLIVVGLPRSGSSLISELLSQAGGDYVFDDLYLRRHAESIGAHDAPMTEDQLDNLIHWLGWQIRARMWHKPFAVPRMAEAEVDDFGAAIKAAYGGAWPTWHAFQKEWLFRLAKLNGCTNWGYNMPGDFLAVDQLRRYYPDARFLFLFRDPSSVLASYKYMKKGHTDGNPAQYHPLAYAFYWRRCADAFAAAQAAYGDDVYSVRFEDLIENPNAVVADVATHFSLAPPGEVELPPPNTSFDGRRRKISGLELGMLNRVLGSRAEDLGYSPAGEPKRFVHDAADLLLTTGRFGVFQARQLVKGGARAKQVMRLLRRGS